MSRCLPVYPPDELWQLQRLLFLRSMRHPRMSATAKPIIISTPAIARARFTGRDYLRVWRMPDLQAGITIAVRHMTRITGECRKQLSTRVNSLHDPQSK